MSIHYWSSKAWCCSSRAVVWSLRSWVSSLGPTKWPFEESLSYLEQSVFLLNSKPWLEIFCLIHYLIRKVSEVSVCRGDGVFKSINSEGLAHYKYIVALSERIGVISNWLKNNFRVASDSLPCWRSIIVPFGKISEGLDFIGKSSLLWSDSVVGSIDPDVFGNNLSSLIKIIKFVPSPKGFSVAHKVINIMENMQVRLWVLVFFPQCKVLYFCEKDRQLCVENNGKLNSVLFSNQ